MSLLPAVGRERANERYIKYTQILLRSFILDHIPMFFKDAFLMRIMSTTIQLGPSGRV